MRAVREQAVARELDGVVDACDNLLEDVQDELLEDVQDEQPDEVGEVAT